MGKIIAANKAHYAALLKAGYSEDQIHLPGPIPIEADSMWLVNKPFYKLVTERQAPSLHLLYAACWNNGFTVNGIEP